MGYVVLQEFEPKPKLCYAVVIKNDNPLHQKDIRKILYTSAITGGGFIFPAIAFAADKERAVSQVMINLVAIGVVIVLLLIALILIIRNWRRKKAEIDQMPKMEIPQEMQDIIDEEKKKSKK
ncbi:hypothetical protein ACFL2D_01185 [Patescibacteria group bacterium]